MIIHRSESRGLADHGWLKSRHTFSFADYYNPERMNFGALRVLNDDFVEAGMGFGTHPHRDMEIISIPMEGTLSHKDSEGNAHFIRKGEVQIMSAGTGIYHSEINASQTDPVKFLQIWVIPNQAGVKPRYDQKLFSADDRKNKFSLVVSPDGQDGSLRIHQDAYFSLTDLDQDHTVTYNKHLAKNGIYIFILNGAVEILGQTFKARDGVGITESHALNIRAQQNAEVLLMEVPV